MHTKGFYLLLFTVLISTDLIAQIDSNKEVEIDFFNFVPEDDSNNQELSISAEKTSKKMGEIITLFGSLEDIAKNFPKFSVIQNEEKRGIKIRPMASDILVKKYWNGQDVSVHKLNTTYELGRIETTTKRIRIECRDHSYVDGDRVRLYVNEQMVRSNIVLKGGYYLIDIDLNEGSNRVDIEALNQGTSGPNTAEFKVYDANGNLLASKEWNILTGYIATLVVNKF